MNTSLYMWGLCHVKFDDVLPKKCQSYDNYRCLEISLFRCVAAKWPCQDTFVMMPFSRRASLANAVYDLKTDYSLIMIYYGNVDQVGHDFGPDSSELKEELKK